MCTFCAAWQRLSLALYSIAKKAKPTHPPGTVCNFKEIGRLRHSCPLACHAADDPDIFDKSGHGLESSIGLFLTCLSSSGKTTSRE